LYFETSGGRGKKGEKKKGETLYVSCRKRKKGGRNGKR